MSLPPQISRTESALLPSSRDGFVTVADAQIEVRRWPGADALLPILLLHEALGSASLWRDFPAFLSRCTGRTVVAWSREGHGASSAMPDTAGFAYLQREADLIPAVLAASGFDRAHCYGHSDGATIAMIAAFSFPDSVAGLILEAPHVLVENVTIAGIAATEQLYRTGDLRQKLARHHRDPDAIFNRWTSVWLAPRFRNWSIADKLPKIIAPTLLIQGVGDRYATMQQIDDICLAIPRCRQIALPSCGHVPHREQTQAVLASVEAFLAGQA